MGFLRTTSGAPTTTPPTQPEPPSFDSTNSDAITSKRAPKVAKMAALNVFLNFSSIPNTSFFNIAYVNIVPSNKPANKALKRKPYNP